MITVVVPPNHTLRVEIEGTDGAFEIAFGKTHLTVRETEGLADSKGRKGVLYKETFGKPPSNFVSDTEHTAEASLSPEVQQQQPSAG